MCQPRRYYVRGLTASKGVALRSCVHPARRMQLHLISQEQVLAHPSAAHVRRRMPWPKHGAPRRKRQRIKQTTSWGTRCTTRRTRIPLNWHWSSELALPKLVTRSALSFHVIRQHSSAAVLETMGGRNAKLLAAHCSDHAAARRTRAAPFDSRFPYRADKMQADFVRNTPPRARRKIAPSSTKANHMSGRDAAGRWSA